MGHSDSQIQEFLDKIREINVKPYEMRIFIKSISEGYDLKLLIALLEEVDDYLTLNISTMIIQLSDEKKKSAISDRQKKGLPIPYLDITSGLDAQQRESFERLQSKLRVEPTVDWERLCFPLEFEPIKRFKIFIEEIIEHQGSNQITTENKEAIDFSDSKAVEKIIAMHELGILNYLKTMEPFKASTNALASALGLLTGIKTTTVQSYINPMSSNYVEQKNNPLTREKTVSIVKTKLAKIGFSSQD